jgi:antitoxin component YwqK of YwqJK toxin-antitoxin module
MNRCYKIIPLLLLAITCASVLQAQVKIITYYPKYDSIGLKTPVMEEFYVSKKDSTLKNGPYMKFSPEGDTLIVCHYKKGLKEGLCGDYYENGRPKYIVHYKDGQKEGDAFYYRITGELIFKEVYKNNTKHKINYTDYSQYSSSGKLQAF